MSGPASVLSRVSAPLRPQDSPPYTTHSFAVQPEKYMTPTAPPAIPPSSSYTSGGHGYTHEEPHVPSAVDVAAGLTPKGLSTALTELEKQLELVTKVDILIADNTELRNSNRSLARQVEIQQRESTALREENTALLQRVQELESALAETRAEAASLREGLRTTSQRLEDKAQAHSDLNTELSKLQLENAQLKQQLEDRQRGPREAEDVRAAKAGLSSWLEETEDGPVPRAGPGVDAYLYDADTGNVTSALAPYLHPAGSAAEVSGVRSPVRDRLAAFDASSSFAQLRSSLQDMERTVETLNRSSAVEAYGHFSDTVRRMEQPGSPFLQREAPSALDARSYDPYQGPSSRYLALSSNPAEDPDFDRTLNSVVERVRRVALEASVAANTLSDHYDLKNAPGESQAQPKAPWKPAGPASPARNPYTFKRPAARRLDTAPNGLGLGLNFQNSSLDGIHMPSVDSSINVSLGVHDATNPSFAPLANTILNPGYLQNAYLKPVSGTAK